MKKKEWTSFYRKSTQIDLKRYVTRMDWLCPSLLKMRLDVMWMEDNE